MSLNVPATLQAQAEAGEISEADFIECIKDSLPYAWSVIETTAKDLEANGTGVAINEDIPPTEQAWGQLFRLVASDAMRSAVEHHFGARLAFQNCCKVGFFSPDAADRYNEFVSIRAQVLNQKPELLNC